MRATAGIATGGLVLSCVGAAIAADYFVATNGNDAWDGRRWDTAKRTIGNAVSAATNAGDVVTVSNGLYGITAAISVARGITVRSLNGPWTTAVRANGACQGFVVSHVDAVIHGFLVSNCYAGIGAGVYMTAGTVENCVLRGNALSASSGGRGGGVGVGSGTAVIRNCLIVGNISPRAGPEGGGAGVSVETGATGLIEHCTITGNAGHAGQGTEGGIRADGIAHVRNSIVYNNTPVNYSRGTLTWANCCAVPLPAGAGNLDADPLFLNPGSGYGLAHVLGDYRLDMASPCIDAGAAGGTAVFDLDGNSRPTDGNGDGVTDSDVGAYEALDATVGPLRSYVAATPLRGFAPMSIAFTAYPCGQTTSGLYYRWDFKDGHTAEGAGSAAVTNLYGPFCGRAMLVLSNAAGESATNYSRPLLAAPHTSYVRPAGAHIAPYATWANAATTIQAAVDTALEQGGTGSVVVVGSGTYAVNSAIAVAQGITVRSLAGADSTVVSANGACRGFYIAHSNAVVDGFTVTNGMDAFYGGGVFMMGGTLQRCVVARCRVTSGSSGCRGGGVCAYTNLNSIRNCVIAANVALRNAPEGNGGGVDVEPGATAYLEHCTVTGNASTNSGGVAVMAGGIVHCRNSIVYNNSAANYGGGGTRTFANSCAWPLPSGAGNIGADPLFASAGTGFGLSHTGGNYRLRFGSPCIDAGSNALVHPGLAADIAGQPRIVGSAVDIGAYEHLPETRGTLLSVR